MFSDFKLVNIMIKRIDATGCKWKTKDIKCSGPIGLEKSGLGRVFLLRWREGREWLALMDQRITPGSKILTYEGRKISKRFEVVDVGANWFEVKQIRAKT